MSAAMDGQIHMIHRDSGPPSVDVATALQQILEEKAIVCRQNQALQKENKALRGKNAELLLQMKQMEIDGLKQQLVALQGNEANRQKTQASRQSKEQASLEDGREGKATANHLFLKAKYAAVQDLTVQRLSVCDRDQAANASQWCLSSLATFSGTRKVPQDTAGEAFGVLQGRLRHRGLHWFHACV